MSTEETPCPARADRIHCNCWYDGGACCACADPPMTNEERAEQGMPLLDDEPKADKIHTSTRSKEVS